MPHHGVAERAGRVSVDSLAADVGINVRNFTVSDGSHTRR